MRALPPPGSPGSRPAPAARRLDTLLPLLREIAPALLLIAPGLWWLWVAFGPLRWLGLVPVLAGLALARSLFQRARFRDRAGPAEGAGVVTIDERRIAYFGPETGGVLDLDDLSALVLVRLPAGPAWRLTDGAGTLLLIPVDASGADALFDLFAALPGLDPARLTDVLARTGAVDQLVWRRVLPLRTGA